MEPIQALHALGQSLWYDNIQRRLLENGELARMIAEDRIRGVTSNPSIFHNAIARSHDYDTALIPMAWAGWGAEAIFYQLAMEDIRGAADLFLPLYHQTQGGDGYVSLEVSPYLAHEAQPTAAEAQRLWETVDRPNLMVKIPATREGIPAITQAIAAGINVNVTLIFSLERYGEVMEAYLRGLEQRVAGGLAVDRIASVASFFVSRVDTKVDERLQAALKAGNGNAAQVAGLAGKAAIANARLAYARFQQTFSGERWERLKSRGARVQRPLWASTSTKNPAYSDVLYVDELIGPETVNTVPPATLEAFAEHGQARLTLEGRQAESQKVIDDLEALGISMAQVTQELEDEGVKAFADAYGALLETIDARRKVAQTGLGPLQGIVAARVAQMEQERVAARMREGDTTLWTSDPEGQAEAGRRLGWMDLPENSRKLIPEYNAFAAEVRAAGFTHALLLGMGGSSLAPEVMSEIFTAGGRRLEGLDLAIVDSTDPAQVRRAARRAPIERTLYIVSSKSGSTSEVTALCAYFWDRAQQRLGEQAGEHFVAVTDPGTSLEKLAAERGFRRVFRADPSVGGRYSALTAFGLLPAALMGIDLERLLARARWMRAQCAPELPAARNPGLVLGAALGEAALDGRDKATLLFDRPYAAFGAWLEQLIAESSGKIGRGILPVDGEQLVNTPKDPQRDRIYIYTREDGALDAKVERLIAAGQPALTIGAEDAYDMGAEFFRWEYAIAVASVVLGVNAFDQPDVQDSKTRTEGKIAAYRQKKALDEGPAAWEGDGVRVYGAAFPGLKESRTASAVIEAFLAQAQPGDYVALNAYLPRGQRTIATLQRLREAVRERTGTPVTVGFGPRFQHSTGQLHKGGANTGLFIQITADPDHDLAIPGQGLSFGTLERAQALGDLEALQARGRRAIRVHLAGKRVEDLLD